MKAQKKYPLLFIKISLLSIFFLSSCENSYETKKISSQFTSKEKHQLYFFFKHILLREEGIYVLFGSKPMISFQAISMPFEEQMKEYEKLPKELRNKIIKVKIAFKYEWWENVKDYLKPTQYLIFQKKTNHAKIKEVFLVGITNTTLVLEKNYDLFKKIVGYDFSPLEKVFEIENESSDFWNKVFKNEILRGLVFGYGLNNSYMFSWWIKAEKSSLSKVQAYINSFSKVFNAKTSDNDMKLLIVDSTDESLNYQNFPLPVFRHLQRDSKIEKYRKEQEKIKRIYKGKDPLEITLQKLCE